VDLSLAASSVAGIITSTAGIITALALLVTSFGVIAPQLRRLRKNAEQTNEKLDTIHTLVNSTLTASIESDLAATKAALAAMRQLVAISRDRGVDPAPETLAAMDAASVKADRLTQQMADRLRSAETLLERAGPSANPRT
jgi:hypothetical protein